MKSVVRIANAGGYWGDDPEALYRQVTGGPVDYVTMDFLAFNFVLRNALGGGGTLSLRVDHQGKTLAHGVLTMELDVPDDVLASVGA